MGDTGQSTGKMGALARLKSKLFPRKGTQAKSAEMQAGSQTQAKGDPSEPPPGGGGG